MAPPNLSAEAQEPTMLESREINTFASGASVALVGRVFGRGLNVLLNIVLARLLSPVEFGIFALGWTIVQMGTLLAPMGLDKGVLQFGAMFYRKNSSRLRNIIFQSIFSAGLVGAAMSAIVIVLAPTLSEPVFNKPLLAPVLRGLAPIFFLFAGLKVTAATTRVSQRVKYSAIAEDILPPLTNILLFLGFFFILGWRLRGALVSASLSFAIALLLGLFYIRRLFPEIFTGDEESPTSLRELLTYSLSTSLTGIFAMFVIWCNRLLVGYYLPEAQVGVFQVVSQLSLLTAIILGAFSAIFAPMIADLHHRREHQKLRETYTIGTKWALYLGIPFLLTTVIAPRKLLVVVFGELFSTGSSALVILMLGQSINLATGAVGWLLMMTGKQRQWLIITSAFFMVSILAGIVLTPRLGLVGAAIATTIGTGSTSIVGLLYAWRRMELHPYDRRYSKGMISLGAAAGAMLLYDFFVQVSPLLDLAVLSTISVVVFFLTQILLGIDREDREFVRLVRRRLGSSSGDRR